MRKTLTGSLIGLVLMAVLLSFSSISAQDTTGTTNIQFEGTTITVDGSGAAVAGNIVTITDPGSYRLSGSLSDGQVVVDSEDDEAVTLILNGVTLSSSTSAPLYIKEAGSAVIVLADGTENVVSDAAAYVYANPEEDEPNAAVFSDDALTISGGGSLIVNGSFNDGLASKDTLTIESGAITVNAVDDGIRGKDWLVIRDAQVNLTTGGDGLKSDNEEDAALGYITIENGSFLINAGGDAIQAETTLTINGGSFDLTSGGGSSVVIDESLSAKGLKASVRLEINGGTFTVDAADDTVHANESVVINGGTFVLATGDDAIHADGTIEMNGGDIQITRSVEGIEAGIITLNGGTTHLVSSDDGVNAAGDVVPPDGYFLHINGGYLVVNAEGDGLDANGSIDMTGGMVIVNGPTRDGNGALDYDGSFQLTGGTLVAVGSAGMMQTPDTSSTQYILGVGFDTALAAGTLVNIQNGAGDTILTFAPSKSFQSIVFSSPALTGGETYTVYQGGSASGSSTDGLYSGETYSAGTAYTNLTTSSIVSQVGGGRGFGRPGGGGGRP